MKLSDEQLDAVVRRDLQETTSAWHAPQWRGASGGVDARQAPPAAGRRRRRVSRGPLAGAGLVLAATAVLGLVLAHPLATGTRQPLPAEPPAGGGVLRPPGDFPLGLSGRSLAWDAQRGMAILAIGGGLDSTSSDEPGLHGQTTAGGTWTWSAASGWRRAGVPDGPPARIAAAVADDPTRGVLVFGGSYAGQALDDTWLWDGARWNRLVPATSPPAGPAVMAWDAGEARLLVVTAGAGAPAGTWSWTGHAWSRIGEAPPGAVAAAWDPAAGAAVLVTAAGGDASAATWALHGSTWTRVADAPPLLVLGGYAEEGAYLAADPGGGLLLVGPGTGFLPQTWVWRPGQPWVRGADVPDEWASGMVASSEGTVLFGGPSSVGGFVHAYRWDGQRWVDVLTRGTGAAP